MNTFIIKMKGYNVFVTKTKYNGLINLVKKYVPEDTDYEKVEQEIREVLQYDPNLPSYSRSNMFKTVEKRKQKALEEGKTLYELYVKSYVKKTNKEGPILSEEEENDEEKEKEKEDKQ